MINTINYIDHFGELDINLPLDGVYTVHRDNPAYIKEDVRGLRQAVTVLNRANYGRTGYGDLANISYGDIVLDGMAIAVAGDRAGINLF